MAARHSAGVGSTRRRGRERSDRRPCQHLFGRPVRAITAAPAAPSLGQEPRLRRSGSRGRRRAPARHRSRRCGRRSRGAPSASWATGSNIGPHSGMIGVVQHDVGFLAHLQRSDLAFQTHGPRAVHAWPVPGSWPAGRSVLVGAGVAEEAGHQPRRAEDVGRRRRRCPTMTLTPRSHHLRIEADPGEAETALQAACGQRMALAPDGDQACRVRSRRSAPDGSATTLGPSTPMSARCSSGRRPYLPRNHSGSPARGLMWAETTRPCSSASALAARQTSSELVEWPTRTGQAASLASPSSG